MQPLNNTSCPLCGQHNQCAAALKNSFDVECWCRDAEFPPELLAKIPEEQRRVSCVCPACVGYVGVPGGVQGFDPQA
ncbi:cysteine-rich CWC family protein [Parathalassolituus penaei]|uniref:Cysteine-rich CWC family protein n=1 Tax=Parathalassolituus penaei TaxID=2997323 RepID=A0A9X3IRK2_9GAMM|nr:cysteine-rich CWC family protein [Parathalassolituus penaei]MCY0963939.1 cysteine-rich CWC family protein [Parathalassolituus penaei]